MKPRSACSPARQFRRMRRSGRRPDSRLEKRGGGRSLSPSRSSSSAAGWPCSRKTASPRPQPAFRADLARFSISINRVVGRLVDAETSVPRLSPHEQSVVPAAVPRRRTGHAERALLRRLHQLVADDKPSRPRAGAGGSRSSPGQKLDEMARVIALHDGGQRSAAVAAIARRERQARDGPGAQGSRSRDELGGEFAARGSIQSGAAGATRRFLTFAVVTLARRHHLGRRGDVRAAALQDSAAHRLRAGDGGSASGGAKRAADEAAADLQRANSTAASSTTPATASRSSSPRPAHLDESPGVALMEVDDGPPNRHRGRGVE